MLTLAACAPTLPMPYMPDSFTLTDAAAPLPADYLVSVRQFAGPNLAGLAVSEPRRLNSWSVYEAAQWYVCVREPSGRQTVYALADGRVAGRIERPAPAFCAGARYEPLG